MITKDQKQSLIQTYGKNAQDSGSTEAQIAILETRIKDLNEHFKKHKKDHHSKVGLIALVNRRRSLIEYLKKSDVDRYKTLIQKLGIRK
ncbi:30S ribosomal protein S15 [Leptospira sp. GIMC2001]|uniref:30S ribosomal protein S15 n=1 Tax=Leptospira sp. GIMC2001 TaxID=1513297 RepID=UPI00234A1308|nr:30S ribosomal protein S15 [Leptospira sp. GIMC2001]WCL48086.1 30S ribosomal protein S15 [Leptospira sp. GIMC2001]